MNKKILLIDYPHPDGWARQKCLKELGCEVRFFNLVESRLWSGKSVVKDRAKIVLSFLRPVRKIIYRLDIIKLNKDLLEAVKEFRPEIVLIIKGDNLFLNTLRKIKKICSPILLNWYGDSVLSPNRKEFIYSLLGVFDFFFLIDEIDFLPLEIRKQIASKNKNVFTLPFAANIDFYHPLELTPAEKKEFQSEVSFIGTINPVRKKVLEQLTDFKLKIWGPLKSDWGNWLTLHSLLEKAYQQKCIFGEDVVKIYCNSDIVIDIHFLFSLIAEIPNVTTRVYEVPASGGFVLTNYSPQLTNLFKIGEEIACYSNEKEMKNLVGYYLKNYQQRKEISSRGRERVLKEHTYLHRLRKMFSLIEKK